MSDALELDKNGEAKMAFVGSRNAIWHGMGHEVPENISPQEIAKVAGADWTVEKRTIWYDSELERHPAAIGGGKVKLAVPKQQALVRTTDDRVLSIVGEKWNPVQNAEAFGFFDEFCKVGSMRMDTAGVIDNRGKVTVWALAKLNRSFTLPGGDVVNGHLLFANPHEFGRATIVEFTPIRVVCNNTLMMALSGGKTEFRVNVNHTKKFDSNLVKEALGLASGQMDAFEDKATLLSHVKFKEEQVKKFFAELFPVIRYKKTGEIEEVKVEPKQLSRNADRLVTLLDEQPGAEMSKGTWWSALNAVTYFTDHEYGRTDQGRLASSWFGTNRRLKLNAMKKAVAFATA